MPLIVRVLVLVAALAAHGCGSCPDTQGNKYECDCTATCNGEPVSSFSTPCADTSSEANEAADGACHAELNLCPGVSCSCSCRDTGNDCTLRQCREAEADGD